MSKLLRQVCTAALALIPIATGIVTLLGIKDPLSVFLGGLGRMLSWMRIGAPAFIYWQSRVVEAFRP